MEKNNSWVLLIIVALASFIIALNCSFMNVAISQLVIDLNTTVYAVQAIISFYTLITASLILVGAKLQDIFGKKKIFVLGAVLFAIGALIAALSVSVPLLFLGWVILEGVGAALMTPGTVAIISEGYDGSKRTVGLSAISALSGIAISIGPLFGGFFTSFFSWRYGFIFELVIMIVVILFNSRIPAFKATKSKSNFDYLGAVLSVSGLVLLVSGILVLSSDIKLCIELIILSIIVLLLFAFVEKRSADPLFDVRLLKDRNLSMSTVIRLISFVIMSGALFTITFYSQTVLGLTAFKTGLILLPMTLGLLIFSVLSPKLINRFNHKTVMALGFIISLVGCIILSQQFVLDVTFLEIVPGMFLFGAGLGFPLSLEVEMALAYIPKESENTSSGFVTSSKNLGMSIGTAIIGIILILGAVGGMHQAVNTYAPEKVSNQQFHDDLHVYFEKLGNVDTASLRHDHSAKSEIVNFVIQKAMAIVMYVIAILLAIGLALTLTLDDKILRRKIKTLTNP